MMLVPYSRKNHSVFNPFQDFDELEKAFFTDPEFSLPSKVKNRSRKQGHRLC